MKTKTTNSKLDDLFVRWKQAFIDNKEPTVIDENGIELPLFNEDGIMTKLEIPDEELDRMWKSSRRIVFFLKEQNQRVSPSERWHENIRGWFAPWKLGYTNFYKRIGLLLYGLSSITMDNSVKFSNIAGCQNKIIDEAYQDFPFAFVEAKKEPGGSRSREHEIKRHLARYNSFVKEEIDILNPGIIVCCGRSQYDFMRKKYFPTDYTWTCTDKDNKLCYDAVSGMIIIHAYHTSYSYKGYTDNVYYDSVMDPIRSLLQTHPDALDNN